MKISDRLDHFQQRHHWAGFPLAVVYKYFDDQGAYLAALITYYGFLSLFPLLLMLVTIMGYLLHHNVGLQNELINSALSQFPAVGDQLRTNVKSLSGNWVALTVGIAGSLYGALGVAQATQNAMNRAWAVPRGERPNPFMARLRSLLFLAVIGTGLLLTTGLSILTSFSGIFGHDVGVALQWLSLGAGVLLNIVLFVATFRVLTARDVSVRDVLPGSIIAGVGWQGLQLWGNYYVGNQVNGATVTYGTFAVVLGLIGYLLLASILVVMSAEINVVYVDRLWPRSLLTPFTNDVDLTDADRRAYTSYPNSERHKDFETVDVTFRDPDERTGAGQGPG